MRVLTNRISALTAPLRPLPYEVIVRRQPPMKKQFSLDTESIRALSLDFSASKLKRNEFLGYLGGSVVEQLPSAQVVTLGSWSWDPDPHRASHREPASPSAYISASLCLS